MSSIVDEITSRRSIRKYKKDFVSRDQILEILEAGRLAPSGNNSQPWRFIIVSNDEKKEEIVRVDHNQEWMLDAPYFIVCVADITSRQKTDFESTAEDSTGVNLKKIIRDTAVCIENMLLQATRLGLGTCWTGWYEQEPMKKVLELDERYYVVGVITVGYADENPDVRPRKAMDELIIAEY